MTPPTLPFPSTRPHRQQAAADHSADQRPPAPTRRPLQSNRNERSTGRREARGGRGSIECSASPRRPGRILGRNRQTTSNHATANTAADPSQRSQELVDRVANTLRTAFDTAGEMRVRLEPPRWEECRWKSRPPATVSRPGWRFRRPPHGKRCSTTFPCCTPQSHRRERPSAASMLWWRPNRKTTQLRTVNRRPTVSSKPPPRGILKADRGEPAEGPKAKSTLGAVVVHRSARYRSLKQAQRPSPQLPRPLSSCPNSGKCAA